MSAKNRFRKLKKRNLRILEYSVKQAVKELKTIEIQESKKFLIEIVYLILFFPVWLLFWCPFKVFKFIVQELNFMKPHFTQTVKN